MLLFLESTFQFYASTILCAEIKRVKFQSLASIRTTWYSVWMLICQASSVRSIITSRLDLSFVSRSFELFQFASVRTFQQHVRTPFSVRQVKWFISKTQIWEDSCKPFECQVYTVRTLSLIRQVVQKTFNHPDVRLHYPDTQALIWKLHAVGVQPSGR